MKQALDRSKKHRSYTPKEIAAAKGETDLRICRNELHFSSGCGGGFGIIRIVMLAPESFGLFVAPQGCGRHGAIAGIQHGFFRQVAYYHLKESDIINGNHMDDIKTALDQALDFLEFKPKFIFLLSTCVDTLLGSDFERLAEEVENERGVISRACYMNPIVAGVRTGPGVTVQKSLYSVLKKTGDEMAINLIGINAAPEESCELYPMFKDSGYELKHVTLCKQAEDFERMANSRFNITFSLLTYEAEKDMKENFGIETIRVRPNIYGPDRIRLIYRSLSERLNMELDDRPYYDEAVKALEKTAQYLKGRVLAVERSFELTRTLLEAGMDVRYLFADVLMNEEEEDLEWLLENHPELTIIPPSSSDMQDFPRDSLEVDLAVGLLAGYYCPQAKTCFVPVETFLFGHRGTIKLLEMMKEALESDKTHYELVMGQGLVI